MFDGCLVNVNAKGIEFITKKGFNENEVLKLSGRKERGGR
jgi:hypothetical protein